MSQENSIKISKFQIDNDGGLLLISKTDELPFLEVNEKGVAFDSGPFTGAFCSLEGLAKFFIITDESKDAFSLQLKFAEGDVYPMGESRFSDEQYSDALDWTITANKKIALKQENKKGYPSDFAKAVINMITKCLEMNKRSLKSNTSLKNAVDSSEREKLIWMAEERYSIVVPDDSILPLRTIGDVIDLVNAQVEDKTDFLKRPRHKTGDIRTKHVHTA